MKRESVKKASLILVAVLTTIASSESVSQTPPSSDPNSEWTGTAEQKIWGLMTVWAEAKYAFPFFDQNPELNWDSTVQAYIPRVIAAADQISYYKLLMELAARLHDGHTAVLPPWGLFEPGTDCPPIEVQVVENKFVIARVGESDELAAQKITPGLEILEIGDGVPIAEYHRDSVLRYNSRGTKQADESINLWSLLYGTADSKVRLKIKDRSGAERTVLLTRNSTCRSGERFQCRLFQWYMAGDVLETRALPDGAVYVCIKNFGNDDLGARFRQMLDTLNLAQVCGMIVDLRHNPGGDSQIADSVSACLTDKPLPTSVWHLPHYIAADRAWGNPPEWTERQDTIRPYTGKRYLGPLVILTGPSTYSA
ncbi:MAG TPA: S41 family peptidase, partial [candidate division Zixibacteria bacterium]|nr:S41 family peptidase [candidate division Zixibacteria bacterium]